MKRADLYFLVANVYLAAALSGTFGAWCVGVFWTLIMFFFMWKDRNDDD